MTKSSNASPPPSIQLFLILILSLLFLSIYFSLPIFGTLSQLSLNGNVCNGNGILPNTPSSISHSLPSLFSPSISHSLSLSYCIELHCVVLYCITSLHCIILILCLIISSAEQEQNKLKQCTNSVKIKIIDGSFVKMLMHYQKIVTLFYRRLLSQKYKICRKL